MTINHQNFFFFLLFLLLLLVLLLYSPADPFYHVSRVPAPVSYPNSNRWVIFFLPLCECACVGGCVSCSFGMIGLDRRGESSCPSSFIHSIPYVIIIIDACIEQTQQQHQQQKIRYKTIKKHQQRKTISKETYQNKNVIN